MRLNNKTKRPSTPSVNLVIEDKEQSTQVYSLANHRVFRGKALKEYRVILKNGPRFTIDTTDKLGTFIRRSTDNKLLGLLKDGKLKRARVEQKFFLSKLDLIPKGDTDEDESNTNQDDTSSYNSVLSPPSATSPSITNNSSSSPNPSSSSPHGSV